MERLARQSNTHLTQGASTIFIEIVKLPFQLRSAISWHGGTSRAYDSRYGPLKHQTGESPSRISTSVNVYAIPAKIGLVHGGMPVDDDLAKVIRGIKELVPDPHEVAVALLI